MKKFSREKLPYFYDDITPPSCKSDGSDRSDGKRPFRLMSDVNEIDKMQIDAAPAIADSKSSHPIAISKREIDEMDLATIPTVPDHTAEKELSNRNQIRGSGDWSRLSTSSFDRQTTDDDGVDNGRAIRRSSAIDISGMPLTDMDFSTPKEIFILRWISFFLILFAIIFLGIYSFAVFQMRDSKTFHFEYDTASHSVILSIKRIIRSHVSVIEQLGSVYPYTASSQTWPNVTLQGYASSNEYGLNITDGSALSIIYSPIIYARQQLVWEAYAKDSIHLLDGNPYFYTNGSWPVSNGIFYYDGKQKKYDNVNDRGTFIPGIKVPIWQVTPARNDSNVMFNQVSNAGRAAAISYALETNRTSTTEIILDASYGLPYTFVYSLLFDPTLDKASGIIALEISWLRVLELSAPKSRDHDLFVVISSPSVKMTFTIRGGQKASFIGDGDLHQSRKNVWKLRKRLALSELITNTTESYTVEIYTSKSYAESYRSQRPVKAIVAIVLCFLYVAIIFIVYDFLLSRRLSYLSLLASTSTSILDQLFPSFIQDRLFKRFLKKSASEVVERSQSRDELTRKASLNNASSFRSLNTISIDSRSEDTAPICEAFEKSTVFFADIAGFTKWSSGHKPLEVFEFLETLFQYFDEAARDNGVFKVETIGDCYMAVTGIPDQVPNHADMMADFAFDIIRCMERVKKRKEKKFPDIVNLNVRVGFHSGPVIAGVVRGDRGRFQLFGDTVRIAGIMEQKSEPGKIHVSNESAKLLRESTESYSLIERDVTFDSYHGGPTYFLMQPVLRRGLSRAIWNLFTGTSGSMWKGSAPPESPDHDLEIEEILDNESVISQTQRLAINMEKHAVSEAINPNKRFVDYLRESSSRRALTKIMDRKYADDKDDTRSLDHEARSSLKRKGTRPVSYHSMKDEQMRERILLHLSSEEELRPDGSVQGDKAGDDCNSQVSSVIGRRSNHSGSDGSHPEHGRLSASSSMSEVTVEEGTVTDSEFDSIFQRGLSERFSLFGSLGPTPRHSSRPSPDTSHQPSPLNSGRVSPITTIPQSHPPQSFAPPIRPISRKAS